MSVEAVCHAVLMQSHADSVEPNTVVLVDIVDGIER